MIHNFVWCYKLNSIGWFLKEDSTPKHKLDAIRAFGSPKLKEYNLSSGKIIKCQGYEPLALDELLQKELINEDDIVTGAKNVPKIWYTDEQNIKQAWMLARQWSLCSLRHQSNQCHYLLDSLELI